MHNSRGLWLSLHPCSCVSAPVSKTWLFWVSNNNDKKLKPRSSWFKCRFRKVEWVTARFLSGEKKECFTRGIVNPNSNERYLTHVYRETVTPAVTEPCGREAGRPTTLGCLSPPHRLTLTRANATGSRRDTRTTTFK